MSDKPNVSVERPVAWVLAEHFSQAEIDELNALVAAKNVDRLAAFITRTCKERDRGIAPITLFDHLLALYIDDSTDEEELEQDLRDEEENE